MTDHKIRVRTWMKASDQDIREGLLGWISVEYGSLDPGRRHAAPHQLDGRFALSFPSRSDRAGTAGTPIVRPVDDTVRQAIEAEILGQLGQAPKTTGPPRRPSMGDPHVPAAEEPPGLAVTDSQHSAAPASPKVAPFDEAALLQRMFWSVPETAFLMRVGIRTVWRLMADPDPSSPSRAAFAGAPCSAPPRCCGSWRRAHHGDEARSRLLGRQPVPAAQQPRSGTSSTRTPAASCGVARRRPKICALRASASLRS
jgi:hypothetical protein